MLYKLSRRLLLASLGIISLNVSAQQVFSLAAAKQYAEEHAYATAIAQKDYESSKMRYLEALSTGLPQINGSIGYNFNVQPQVFLLPDFNNPNSGEFIQLDASPPTTVSFGLTGSMTLLDGTYIMGVRAGKTFKELSLEQKNKAIMDIKKSVTQSYYQVLILRENVKVLESTLANLERVLFETNAYVKEGFREILDADQVKLNVDMTQNTLIKSRTQAALAERNLKLNMGFPVDEPISLSDDFITLKAETPEDYILNAQASFDVQQNVQLRIMEKLYTVNKQNKALEMSRLLPNLKAFVNYSYNAFSNEKRQPVLFGSSNTFYTGGTVVGLTLNVPIFSSLNRYANYKKTVIETEKVAIQKKQTEEGLKVQYENVRKSYADTWQTLQNDISNLQLAERIRKTNRIKFQEGLIGSFELTNAESQYLQALSAYYNTLYTLINYKLDFDSITNRL